MTTQVQAVAGGARGRIIPIYFAVLLVFHLLLPLALLPYCFTWWGIPAVLVGNCIFGSIGINLGYHRLLTHRSLEVPPWLEKLFVMCGVCSLEGPPLRWVVTHRMHHQESDATNDPHSPLASFYWGHVGWTYTKDPRFNGFLVYERYATDLLTDPFQRWLHKRNHWLYAYLLHVVLILGVAMGIAWLATGDAARVLQVGVMAFVWGVVVRTVYVWHITWLVNSAAHRWGYRNYETADRSRNNWLVALLTNGEGWHNNHHAAPRSAAHGHRWWEIDLTYSFIRALELLGLARQVVPISVPSYRKIDAGSAAG